MSRPQPFTPPDCDLTSHTYFPLHYDRLLRSKWWRRASDLARSRNMDLWAHAFREIPAASLPDDDADLADMAGFGRDIGTFLKVKDELLEPWVLCADGRWYHPTLSEVAAELWDRMDAKRKANRDRQNAHRQRIRDAVVTAKTGAVTRDTPPSSRVTPPEELPPVTLQPTNVTPISGPKERKETNLGSNEPVALASQKPTFADDEREAFRSYNEMANRLGLPVARKLDEARRKAIRRRLQDGGLDAWHRALSAVSVSPHCRGENDRGWRADLDFICQPKSWRRLLEGSYGGAVVALPVEAWPDARWAAAIDIWRETARWDAAIGPEPGQPGCRAPTHLLIQPAAAQGVQA